MLKPLMKMKDRKWNCGINTLCLDPRGNPLTSSNNNSNNRNIKEKSMIKETQLANIKTNVSTLIQDISNSNISIIQPDRRIKLNIAKANPMNITHINENEKLSNVFNHAVLCKLEDEIESKHCYGSPAIWLKNMRRISENQRLMSNPEQMRTFRLGDAHSKTRNINANTNKENDMFFHFNKSKKSISPVLLKLRKTKNDPTGDEKKIHLYSHQPSLIVHAQNVFDSHNENSFNNNLQEFKTLIFKNRLSTKGKEKRFSNINQVSKLSDGKEKTEIDEYITTGSNLEYSQFHKRNEEGSFSVDDKGKIKKIITPPNNEKNNQSSNDLKISKTNPNSSNSNSNENKSENCRSSPSDTDSMFKTLTQKVEMDPFLHKTFEGKIRWKAGEVLSEGASSVVYKALNEDLGSIFVVKRFIGINNPQAISSFQNEVKFYQQLEHPNIIKFLESDVINQNVFIYLEFMSGGSIKYILDGYGPLNENLIKIYLRQILEGLEYLHSKGIVHRDIKCANILLDIKGNIKLSDFGCAGQLLASVSDSSSNEEFLSSLKGTLPWCAPEVICHKKYGKKADIWSLGCTLIEMLGSRPWSKLENEYQVMNMIGRSNDIPEIPQSISDSFRDFILSCLKRDPKERANIKNLKNHTFLKGY